MAVSFTIALAGNPNAGKSTIFNALTGARQHVGNWPGKTVEKKEGLLRIAEHEIAVVDLPGTYSLSAFSIEEVVSRDFIVKQQPNAVISVVDAANLERNLYLVIQLLEMGAPVLLALNMIDLAENRQISINEQKLSQKLGNIPVVRVVGNRQVGIDDLKAAIVQLAARRDTQQPASGIHFHEAIEAEIAELQTIIEQDTWLQKYPSRWIAIKLLEADEHIREAANHNIALKRAVEEASNRLTERFEDDPELLIADARYAYIAEITQAAVIRPTHDPITLSDKLDNVLTHRVWGLPIFFAVMWLIFQFTANVSAPYLDWLDGIVSGPFSRWITAILGAVGMGDSWLESLLVDGVIAGVGGVLVFIPVLFSLYFAIALLEDSGYMARAAFVMDRFMQLLGLHGKSFLPLLVGFGCTVPAIYATRTLENETDRKITGFLATFISCGARLPVYVVFGAAFFGSSSGNLVFAMYISGIAVIILTSLLMNKIIYRNKPTPPFVLELPPYRVPHARTVLISTWERSAGFVRKAGTTIMTAAILIWLLLAIPVRSGEFAKVEPENSLFGTVSKASAPILAPAGFGDWRAGGALVTGFVAKEVIVSTMTQVYIGNEESEAEEATPFLEDMKDIAIGFGEATVLTVQEVINIAPRTVNLIPGANMPEANFLNQTEDKTDQTALETALQAAFSPLSAVAFNVFILLYIPCMAATAAMRHEFGTRWMMLQAAYTLGIAWLAAVLVYQLGSLIGV